MASASGLTAEHTLDLIGDVISGARVVDGTTLVMSTMGGLEFDVGDVRGVELPNPTAAAMTFTPAAGIAATNTQAALVEAAGDLTSLATTKADASAIPRIMSGRVTHVCETGQFGGSIMTTVAFTNVFPAGFFSANPRIIISIVSSIPEWFDFNKIAVTGVTTRSFSIRALAGDDNGAPRSYVFNYVAMQDA